MSERKLFPNGPKLKTTFEQREEMRALYKQPGQSLETIAKAYGLSPSTIRVIVMNKYKDQELKGFAE